MKKGRTANRKQKEYALRRVIYDVMLAAKSLIALANGSPDFAEEESFKVAALIMVRNLDAFFFGQPSGHGDDIHHGDFGLTSWKPDESAKLQGTERERINKIVGHVVSSRPAPFNKRDEVPRIVIPLIGQASDFVRACRKENAVAYTGKAAEYAKRLNGILPVLGIAELP